VTDKRKAFFDIETTTSIFVDDAGKEVEIFSFIPDKPIPARQIQGALIAAYHIGLKDKERELFPLVCHACKTQIRPLDDSFYDTAFSVLCVKGGNHAPEPKP
jgi:hypothetical protein